MMENAVLKQADAAPEGGDPNLSVAVFDNLIDIVGAEGIGVVFFVPIVPYLGFVAQIASGHHVHSSLFAADPQVCMAVFHKTVGGAVYHETVDGDIIAVEAQNALVPDADPQPFATVNEQAADFVVAGAVQQFEGLVVNLQQIDMVASPVPDFPLPVNKETVGFLR